MKKIAKFISLFLLLITSACATLDQADLVSITEEEAVSVIGYETTMDGKAANESFKRFCHVFLEEQGSNKEISYMSQGVEAKWFGDRKYFAVKSKPGNLELSSMMCGENRVFYNKMRQYNFDDGMYFEALPGQINYAGHLTIDLTTDSFKVTDLLFTGAGGFTNDSKAKATIKLTDDIDAAREAFYEEFPETSDELLFEKSLFKDHPDIIK